MMNAVEKVRQRLLRAAAALEKAGVPCALAEGNAVAAWVSRVDEAAVRNTQDVLVRTKLTSFRDKGRTHLRDLTEVGLIEANWLSKVPDTLAPRLRDLIEHPED